MGERVQRDAFVRAVGSAFHLRFDTVAAVDLTLERIVDADAEPAREAFSLVFVGPPHTPLGPGLYAMEHEALGALQILLGPAGLENGAPRYEAVFDRKRVSGAPGSH